MDWKKSFLSVFIELTACGTNLPELKKLRELTDVSNVEAITLSQPEEVVDMLRAEVILAVAEEVEEAT